MAGAICGAYAGIQALPQAWLDIVAKVNDLDIATWSERLARCANMPAEAPLKPEPIRDVARS